MGTPLHTDDPLAALLPTSRFLMSSHSIDDIFDNDNQSQQLSGEGHSIARTLTSCKTGSVQTLASQGNPPAPSRITWSNKRTDRIMDWLEKHPVGQNRPVVRNTKSVRVPIVRRIARHVFKNDSKEEFCIAVDHHRKQFGESVQSRLDHLGKKYKECVRSLSGTGAGLSAEELASSGFSNPIDNASISASIHHFIGTSQNNPVDIDIFLRSRLGDPATKGFLPKLRSHVLPRLKDLILSESGNPASAPLSTNPSTINNVEWERPNILQE
ncbi:hypothetical protein SERLA73DRAFT_80064 [Serpula lacrymans var. lacrymans S7.3]|uniref:Uncharacterized protein n=1 Tax=Serpula lacrymans var. lacrymans (strain S7.3) TaxID=936435 RepID=F8QIK4_SERL3|nr:hypothetical protein SERLA73DRAFT_80064 [Serpula lacrymans var. lacrymans S7.3]